MNTTCRDGKRRHKWGSRCPGLPHGANGEGCCGALRSNGTVGYAYPAPSYADRCPTLWWQRSCQYWRCRQY